MRWIASSATLVLFLACAHSATAQNPRPQRSHYAACPRFREIDVLKDMCPAFQQSELDSFQALFPDVSILAGLGHDADLSLLFGHQPLAASPPIADRIATHTPSTQATRTPVYTRSKQERTPLKSQGPLLSFEEWQKRVLQDESERPPSKRKGNGMSGLGKSQQMIDSIDGLVDDLGAMFEAVGQNSVAANVYDEGAYIEPSRSSRPATEQTQLKKPRIADVPIKSLKERFNYASIDCAATVRGVNKAAKGAQSIIYESKDQYMLNKCASDKYVIINLCEAVLIDTIVMANFEFFSSTFKDFRVYVADRYPTKEWHLLGQWQARNTRDLQVFRVNNKIGWFEYIKIEFLTHYGHEYYCPLSLVRVHGMSMMEYYNRVESRGLSSDDEAMEDEYMRMADIHDEIISPKLDHANDSVTTTMMPEHEEEHEPISAIAPIAQRDSDREHHPVTNVTATSMSASTTTDSSYAHSTLQTEQELNVPETKTAGPLPSDEPIPQERTHEAILPDPEPVVEEKHTSDGQSYTDTALPIPSTQSEESTGESASSPPSSSREGQEQDSSSQAAPLANTNTGATLSGADAGPTASSTGSQNTSRAQPTSGTPSQTSSTLVGHTPETTEDVSTRMKLPVNPHGKEGNTQESIYKTIMKRLNALEVNATLSQRFLDEQNAMLNTVFITMEKRHQEQLLLLLEQLNETASHRIEAMKRRYEYLHEELRERAENDKREMAARISLLTEQIAFEHRVSMAQLVIVITLFVFVALSRGTFSILSPILVARAQERKRRESVSQSGGTNNPTHLQEHRPSKTMRTLSAVAQSSWSSSTLSLMSRYSPSKKVVSDESLCSSNNASQDAAVPELALSSEPDTTPECDKHMDDNDAHSSHTL